MAINIPIISSLDSKGFDKAIAEFKSLEGASAKTAFALKKAFVPAVAVLGGLAAAAMPAISAASDLNETISKTSVIFGDADKALFTFADTAATTLGQTKQQALDAAATFGTFGKAAGLSGQELAGFSTDFTKLASDLSSFNNSTPQEAIDALGAALRGESEPLRKFGVLLSADAIAAEALRMGLVTTTVNSDDLARATAKANIAFEKHNETLKKYGEGSIEAQKSALALSDAEARLNSEVEGTNDKLTAQQKTLATQSLIMNATKDAQGDFARTSDGLANSQRILTAQMKDLQANLGQVLLPIVTAAVGFFSQFTGVLAGNQQVMVIVIGVVAALAAAIIVANIGMKIYTATTKAAAAATALFNFVMSANPIVLVVIAVAAIVAALIILENKFGAVTAALRIVGDGFTNGIINPVKAAIGLVADLVRIMGKIPGVSAIGGLVGKIPGFADGGIVTRPTLAMVGEKGPEAIVPLGRGGGVGGITINVNGGISTGPQIGQAVYNALLNYKQVYGPLNALAA